MTNWTSKDLTGKCGVYIIKNKVNGKFYIGSSVSIWNRWNDHKWELRKGIHKNKHLQSAWNKYGEENFEFDVLEFCSEEIQFQREQIYIDKYWGNENFYNQNDVAIPNVKPEKKEIFVYNETGLLNHFNSVNECGKWLIDNEYVTSKNTTNLLKCTTKNMRDAIIKNEFYCGLVISYEELTKNRIIRIYKNKDNPSIELSKINHKEKVKSNKTKKENFHKKEIYIYDTDYNLILHNKSVVIGLKRFIELYPSFRYRIKKRNGSYISDFVDRLIKSKRSCGGFIFSYEPLEQGQAS